MKPLTRIGFALTLLLVFYPENYLSSFPWLYQSPYIDLVYLMEKLFYPMLLITLFIVTLFVQRQRSDHFQKENTSLYSIAAWITPLIFTLIGLLARGGWYLTSNLDSIVLPLLTVFPVAAFFRYSLLYGKMSHLFYLIYIVLVVVAWVTFLTTAQNLWFVTSAIYLVVLALIMPYKSISKSL